MRRTRLTIIIVSGSLMLAALAACAASEPESTPPGAPSDDGGASSFVDAASPEDGGTDASREPARCSDAGWCTTKIPNDDLEMKDIWPFEHRAFAIASSASRGGKVLEWSDSTDEWRYIDDESQNAGPSVGYPVSIWAPNEDEVYYSVLYFGIRAEVYYGKRPAPPETAWSWKNFQFDCSATDLPFVWGVGEDVYVVMCNTIYRLERHGDGGGPSWVADYSIDASEGAQVRFYRVTGTAPDDLWFVGFRPVGFQGACTVIVRKTSLGYRVIADAISTPTECQEKPGLLKITGARGYDNEPFVHAPARGQLVGIVETSGVRDRTVRIAENQNGTYAVTYASPLPAFTVNLGPVWGTSEDDLWFLSTHESYGPPLNIMRGTNIWNDGGAFQYSTLALNGAPNEARLIQLRGTSNTNLWAIGVSRAFHKTTP